MGPSVRKSPALQERVTHAERACSVGAAAAHDLNDELTIILTAASEALATVHLGHRACPHLFDLQAAAQRSAWKVAHLLNYAERGGATVVKCSMEKLIAEEQEKGR